MKQGILYTVIAVLDNGIRYSNWCANSQTRTGHYGIIGRLSQERIEWVGVRPIRKITKPEKEIYESSL